MITVTERENREEQVKREDIQNLIHRQVIMFSVPEHAIAPLTAEILCIPTFD